MFSPERKFALVALARRSHNPGRHNRHKPVPEASLLASLTRFPQAEVPSDRN